MMKTNNEMSATPSYIAPVAKVINAKLEGLICQSQTGASNEEFEEQNGWSGANGWG